MVLVIEGKRIVLRTPEKSDARSIQENLNDKEVSRYTRIIPYPYTLRHARDFIKIAQQQQHRRGGSSREEGYSFGIEIKQTHKIIGVISLTRLDCQNRNAEVGYWLGKKYWGRGLAKEALLGILDFGFGDLKLFRIYANVMHPNTASAKLLEKAGFELEGRMRKSVLKDGEWLDELRYSMLEEEYTTGSYSRLDKFKPQERRLIYYGAGAIAAARCLLSGLTRIRLAKSRFRLTLTTAPLRRGQKRCTR
jgi:RimJ/RimL family protein N-acetyltransferase